MEYILLSFTVSEATIFTGLIVATPYSLGWTAIKSSEWKWYEVIGGISIGESLSFFDGLDLDIDLISWNQIDVLTRQ